MLAALNHNQTKARTRDNAGRAEVAREGKDKQQSNPVWQSLALGSMNLQPKLAVSQPDDPYEREADHVADRVMRMATPHSSTPISKTTLLDSVATAQRKCASCEEEEDEKVQRKDAGANVDSPAVAPPVVGRALSSPGQSLDSNTRSFFEPRFGFDFSQVRIHNDALAAESARAVNASAYTVGQDVVFGSGKYSPETDTGKTLLAHELAHVIQQRGTPAGSEKVGARKLQRSVRETVVSNTQPGAQVCMVHLHGDEQNARQVALSLFGTHCANLVDLSSTARAIHVDLAGGGTCLADPNRIFTPTGITSHAIVGGCSAGSAQHTQAQADLVSFRDSQLIPAIATCRGNTGGGLSGGLPIVAFHNNTSISIASYRPGGPEAGAVEHDPARTGGATNPNVAPGRHAHDFMLTTDPRDFEALRATHNVVLQSTAPTDDGSLSVALANDRYVNIEGFDPAFTSTRSRFFINDMAMALDVFRQLGVGRKPCDSGATPGTNILDAIVDFFRRLFDEIGRVLDEISTLPEPLTPEAVPSPPPRGCRVFADAAALNTRKAAWVAIIAGMPIADVVSWIIGVTRPPRAARTESDAQRDCLMRALAASGFLPTGTSTAPVSGYRSFADQRAIWNRKFDFVFHGAGDRRNRFDLITSHARTRCGSLIGATETQWNTENPSHRACWGAPALASTPTASVPAAPSGGPLSDEEKQQEILRASSAPGISRHHLGTDYDFFSTEAVDWAPGGRFFDTYRWLRANAITYGFIQTFTPMSTFMRLGYMDERWHWSYYPIAQALLEFARAHQGDIEANLTSPAQWGGAARFSYILSHWQEFMFNVEQSP